jgi:hypothetical protein
MLASPGAAFACSGFVSKYTVVNASIPADKINVAPSSMDGWMPLR